MLIEQWVASKQAISKAKKYADEVTPTVRDYLNNPDKKQKIWYNHFLGKIAEEGVYQIYKDKKDSTISPPDYKIYIGSKKSYSADLVSEKYNYHVKSQTQEKIDQYGASYLFANNDPVTLRPTEKDMLVLCSIDTKTYTVSVLKEIPAREAQYTQPQHIRSAPNRVALRI